MITPRLVPEYWPVGKSLYKYVDVADAHYLASGSIKIGTLRGFSKIEGARQDKEENFQRRTIKDLRSTDPDAHAIANKTGIFYSEKPVENWSISGFNITMVGPNHHAFCLSHRGDLPDPDDGRKQALYEIPDIRAFLRQVLNMRPDLQDAAAMNVVYDRTEADIKQEPWSKFSPFLKPPSFAFEHEVRCLFTKEIAEDCPDIYTEPNQKLAKLIRRVR